MGAGIQYPNFSLKPWQYTPMTKQPSSKNTPSQSTDPLTISTLDELAALADYSLMDSLHCDPDAIEQGANHTPRQVFSGHYVPVTPTPIKDPEYVAHSQAFFAELGFNESLVKTPDFMRIFSGDLAFAPSPMRKFGWATGYALSIYGTEYTQQCPFHTGNGYGDGRAISVLEAVVKGQRWEMQLKGGGPTPYCRGADGRAVLRSSVREFLAQDHMHALGVPTSRSLSLFVSKTERVNRPWYSPGSCSQNPDVMVSEAVAISTRVAPSFIRVGQLELFARRSRYDESGKALQELEKLVLHLIDREYADVIDHTLSIPEKVVLLAREYRARLASLIGNWIRVGFCQGNFNSDNCAVGGYTLDYGPFGFSDVYDPHYQPWTGGGHHFSFMNQPSAAQRNFGSFCAALKPLLASHENDMSALEEVQRGFSKVMNHQMGKMWAAKLGLSALTNADNTPLNASFNGLLSELESLMIATPVDYTIFFRELSSIPDDITPLKKSYYQLGTEDGNDARWRQWLVQWKALLESMNNLHGVQAQTLEAISNQMKQVNPKYILREWFLVPAYEMAKSGDYSEVQALQAVMSKPYAEQSKEVEEKYYRLKPLEFFDMAGLSHLSCSS